MKNAQLIGQVFLFILAGLVFVLIISYGYQAIMGFIGKQEQILLVDLKNDLQAATESIKREYGSVRKLTLRAPSSIEAVCFFDSQTCATTTPEYIDTTTFKLTWAQEACTLGSANVVSIPRTEDIYIPSIRVDSPGYTCIKNVNGITLRLEGTGREAKVRAWT